MTDKLDIFEIDPKTIIQTTALDLQKLYFDGWNDGESLAYFNEIGNKEAIDRLNNKLVIVNGDVV